jgi:hypothetical protein
MAKAKKYGVGVGPRNRIAKDLVEDGSAYASTYVDEGELYYLLAIASSSKPDDKRNLTLPPRQWESYDALLTEDEMLRTVAVWMERYSSRRKP